MNAFWLAPHNFILSFATPHMCSCSCFLPEVTLAHVCNDKKWSSEILMVTILFDQHLCEVVYIPLLNLSYFELGCRFSESWIRESKDTYKKKEVDMFVWGSWKKWYLTLLVLTNLLLQLQWKALKCQTLGAAVHIIVLVCWLELITVSWLSHACHAPAYAKFTHEFLTLFHRPCATCL